MIVVYIILGLIVLGVAIFLFKFLLMLLGLPLVGGFVTWLIWDNFWIGAAIGGVITLITILRNPGEYFSDLIDEASRSGSLSSSSSSSASKEYITDRWGNKREVRYRDSNSMWDDYGNHYRSDDGGSTWYDV